MTDPADARTDSPDRRVGTRVYLHGCTYEWDGADWWCPSRNHDPEANFDLLLDRIERLTDRLAELESVDRPYDGWP